MSTKELIDLLRSDSCGRCGYIDECTAEKRDCLLNFKAADMLELAEAEKQAAFSLGQMDMRLAAQSALIDVASTLNKFDGRLIPKDVLTSRTKDVLGVIAATYRQAAEIVGGLVIT